MAGKENPFIHTWGEVVREKSWKPIDYISTCMFPSQTPQWFFLIRVSSHFLLP